VYNEVALLSVETTTVVKPAAPAPALVAVIPPILLTGINVSPSTPAAEVKGTFKNCAIFLIC
jgi:hypothetical protein